MECKHGFQISSGFLSHLGRGRKVLVARSGLCDQDTHAQRISRHRPSAGVAAPGVVGDDVFGFYLPPHVWN